MSDHAERLRAMVRLLSPDEMTPMAKRMLLSLAAEWDAPRVPLDTDEMYG